MEKSKMKKPCVHLICNAHLDPVWQWRWEEGCAEAISTFRNAARLLREHGKLIFNHNEAVLYRWVKKYDPKLFKEIQKLVKEGRWCISGGWYLQPDVNLPGTESIIRQIAEGLMFFREHFNVRPKVAYNFDSFGHSGGLPQILCLAGYEMYIHMRPQQKDLDLPSDLYCWRGVDGTEIACFRIAIGLYHTEYGNIEHRLREGVDMALKLNRDVPVFWGIGNHGGGPTKEDLEKIDAFIEKESRVDLIHSTPDRFYEAVKDALKSSPVFERDLQRVFTGCYTSLSRLKREAQRSLGRIVRAEALSTSTWWLYGKEYPQEELEEAWRDHLFNDFHDIITGTCIEPAEKDALNLYGKISESARRISLQTATAFNQHQRENLPQTHDYTLPVTVLNANPSLTKVPVEVECMISHRPKMTGDWHFRAYDPGGEEIPCQEEQPEALLPFNRWRRKVVFMSELPGIGFKNYMLKAFDGEKKSEPANPMIRFQVGEKSGLVEKLGADEGRQLLTGPLLEPLVIEDKGDSWGTDCWEYRKLLGRFKLEPGSRKVIEEGPIRTIHESFLSYNHSQIIMHTIAYIRWPVLEYRLRVHWNEEYKLLKLSTPTVFKNKFLFCEVPGGIIQRPSDGQEHVSGRWFMLRGKLKGKDTALGVVNNGQHGLDFKDGEVRLSVLRSAPYCHEQGLKLDKHLSPKYMDQGVHDIRLLVVAGDAASVLQLLPSLADWLSVPPVVYPYLPVGSVNQAMKNENDNTEKTEDIEEKTGIPHKGWVEVLSLEPENVRVLACKRSWGGKALTIRLQECWGLQSNVYMQIEVPKLLKLRIKSTLNPMQIKTFRIEKSGQWREVDMISEV